MIASGDQWLSPGQQGILADGSRRILVAAGAGSGKTRLLVAYFLKALLEDGVPLDGLAAVTFTKKAAAELLSRIREALYEAGRPDLARDLDGASIGTIHGLCSRLLRGNAVAAGIDPAFSVLEAEAASLLKEEVRAEIWSEAVEQATEAGLEVLARHRRTFEEELVPLYERLRSLGMARFAVRIATSAAPDLVRTRARLLAAAEGTLKAASEPVGGARKGGADICLVEECLTWLTGPGCRPSVVKDFDSFVTEAASPAGAGSTPDSAASAAVGSAHLARAGAVPTAEATAPMSGLAHSTVTVAESAAAAAAALEATKGFFPSRRARALQDQFEEVRSALTAYRQSLAALCLWPMLAATNDLLGRFHTRYLERKRERGLLDFSDLELSARALVETRTDGDTSFLGAGSRLMVDEFQDTNQLQCSILDGLHAAAGLMVGDERQSIYRFRGADVDVFMSRQHELLLHPEEGAVHRLDVSYRARAEVLEFINRLFAGPGFFGPRHAPLRCGRAETGRSVGDSAGRTDRLLSPAVEILCSDRLRDEGLDGPSPSMQQAEAEAVAARVLRLVTEEGWQQRDVVVLLPALTQVDAYHRALSARNISTYVVRGKGYYSREEISDLRCLLGVLVDPHDDLALLALLRSPLVGLSDDALFYLGREAKNAHADSLWAVVRDPGCLPLPGDDQAPRLSRAVSVLETLARYLGRPGLARLIDRAVTAFEYDLCLLAAPEGRRRFANVRKLMRLADEYETVEGPDLAGFVRLIDTIGELSDDEGSAPTLAEDEDAVRVMTIHQAKGLEFPVVVLAGLGSDSPGSRNGAYLVGHDGRMAVVLKDSRRPSYETCDLALGPAEEIIEDEACRERDEDVRLMYVAMTRAQERLFLVGARPSGPLESCRLGRIALALGLDGLPAAGETWGLQDLDAVVRGVAGEFSGEDAQEPRLPRSGEAGEPDLNEACPVFLESVASSVAVRRVSFSSLAAYRRCPRRYYLERLLGLDVEAWADQPADASAHSDVHRDIVRAVRDGDRGDDGGGTGHDAEQADAIYLDPAEAGDGRELGLFVHRLLERLPLHDLAPNDEKTRLLIQECLDDSSDLLAQGSVERAVELTRAFWRTDFGGRQELVGAFKEAPFMFLHGEMMVSGVMDLAWQEGRDWHVIDYKTNRLAGRTPREVGESYREQARVYALALLLAGARTVSMHFLFLERPEEPFTLDFAPSDIPALQAELDESLVGLAGADFSVPAGTVCGDCPAARLCSKF